MVASSSIGVWVGSYWNEKGAPLSFAPSARLRWDVVMARIVLGVGSSHSQLLLIPGELWAQHTTETRGLRDADVASARREKYRVWCSPSHWTAQSAIAQQCLQRIAGEITRAESDVVLVIGNDDNELFGSDNLPAISVYHGADVAMLSATRTEAPDWSLDVQRRYGVGTGRVHKGAPLLASSLITELIRRNVDVAAAASVPDPTQRGFGRAFGFVAERLLGGPQVPILPIVLNTHFPPNILSAQTLLRNWPQTALRGRGLPVGPEGHDDLLRRAVPARRRGNARSRNTERVEDRRHRRDR